ncbi:MAG: winged helix-turn-helix transcriptional regulator [Thermoplasmatota archaeon]
MNITPRRVVLATCIFLGLSLSTVAAAGYHDTSHVPAGPLPATFQVAQARVGDKANYTWDHVKINGDGTVTVLEEHDMLGVEWLDPRPMRDALGALHDTNTLHQWGWQKKSGQGAGVGGESNAGPWERYAEPVFAIDRHDHSIAAYSYISETAADPNQRYGGAHMLQSQLLGPGSRFLPNCEAIVSYQGQSVPLDRYVNLFGSECEGFSNAFQAPSDVMLRAVGTQQIDDRTTVLFSSKDNALQVWLDPALPFPVRVASQTVMPGSYGQRVPGEYNVMRMERFQRGTTPIVWNGTPAGSPATPWDMKPLANKVPDEAGIQHPFPASAAITAAQTNPNGQVFGRVLGGGYVTFLDYRDSRNGDTIDRSWDISAYDGTENASVTVTQHTAPVETNNPLPVPTPSLPTQAPRNQTTITVRATSDRGGGPWPAPSLAPQAMPTVASMLRRWHDFASNEYATTAPNAWGLRIGCLGAPCNAAGVYVERWAGVQSERAWTNVTPVLGNPQTERIDLSSILTESDNSQRGHEVTLNEQTYTWHNSAPAPERNTPPPSTGQLTIIRGSAWVFPATGVAEGGALAGLLAGLAFLFWPAAKGGFIGLFSRHAPAQVPEHPERSRMLQAIEANPGVHVRELGRILGRGRSPTEHHLAKLREAGAVRIVDAGGYRCVFPRTTDARVLAGAGATRTEAAQRILASIKVHPGVGVRELARVLDLSPSTVHHHLQRLRAGGLVSDGASGLHATAT